VPNTSGIPVFGDSIISNTEFINVLPPPDARYTIVTERIAVMYAGRIVEQADVHTLYRSPGHPYTRGLLDSIPRLDSQGSELRTITGLPPNLMRIRAGCAFHPRCPYAQDICRSTVPPPVPLGPDRFAADFRCGRGSRARRSIDSHSRSGRLNCCFYAA